MNNNFITNKKNKTKQVPFKPLTSYKTTANIDYVLQIIMEQVNNNIYTIQRKKYLYRMLLKNCLKQYNDFNNMYHNQYQPNMTRLDGFSYDDQPKTISLDSLSAYQMDNIKINLKKKQLITKSLHRNASQKSFQSVKLQSMKYRISQLPLTIIEQKAIVNEMRNKKIAQQQNRASLQKSKSISINPQKICFDYNGQILQTNDQQRTNLIQSTLVQKYNQSKLLKKVDNQNESQRTSNITKTQDKKYKFKNKKQSKIERQSIDFSNYQGQPLIQDVQMHKVYQPKPVKRELKELKSSISKKRLSRDQYNLITKSKELETGLRYKKTKTQMTHIPRSTHSRAFSQANLNKRFKRDIINIYNPELRQSLLIKLTDYDPFLRIQKDIQDNQTYQNNSTKIEYQSIKAPSVSQQIQYKTVQSRASSRSKFTQKLPMINLIKPIELKQEDMILTRLHNQLKNKLKV